MTLKHHDAIKVITVRATAFPPAESGGSAAVDTSKQHLMLYISTSSLSYHWCVYDTVTPIIFSVVRREE